MNQNVPSSEQLCDGISSTKTTDADASVIKEDELDYSLKNYHTSHVQFENQHIFSNTFSTNSNKKSSELNIPTTESVSVNGSYIKNLPLTKSSLEQIFSNVDPAVDNSLPARISRGPLSTSSSEQSNSEGILCKFFSSEEEIEHYKAIKRKKREEREARRKRKSTDLNHINVLAEPSWPALAESNCDISTILTETDYDLDTKRNDMLCLLELDEVYRTVKNPSTNVNVEKTTTSKCSKYDFSYTGISPEILVENITVERNSSKLISPSISKRRSDLYKNLIARKSEGTSVLIAKVEETASKSTDVNSIKNCSSETIISKSNLKAFSELSLSPSHLDSNTKSPVDFLSMNFCDSDSKSNILNNIISEHSASHDSDSKSSADLLTTIANIESNSKLSIGTHSTNSCVIENSQFSVLEKCTAYSDIDSVSESSVETSIKGFSNMNSNLQSFEELNKDSKIGTLNNISSEDSNFKKLPDFSTNLPSIELGTKLPIDIPASVSCDIDSNSHSSIDVKFISHDSTDLPSNAKSLVDLSVINSDGDSKLSDVSNITNLPEFSSNTETFHVSVTNTSSNDFAQISKASTLNDNIDTNPKLAVDLLYDFPNISSEIPIDIHTIDYSCVDSNTNNFISSSTVNIPDVKEIEKSMANNNTSVTNINTNQIIISDETVLSSECDMNPVLMPPNIDDRPNESVLNSMIENKFKIDHQNVELESTTPFIMATDSNEIEKSIAITNTNFTNINTNQIIISDETVLSSECDIKPVLRPPNIDDRPNESVLNSMIENTFQIDHQNVELESTTPFVMATDSNDLINNSNSKLHFVTDTNEKLASSDSIFTEKNIEKSTITDFNISKEEIFDSLDKIFNDTSPKHLQSNNFFGIEQMNEVIPTFKNSSRALNNKDTENTNITNEITSHSLHSPLRDNQLYSTCNKPSIDVHQEFETINRAKCSDEMKNYARVEKTFDIFTNISSGTAKSSSYKICKTLKSFNSNLMSRVRKKEIVNNVDESKSKNGLSLTSNYNSSFNLQEISNHDADFKLSAQPEKSRKTFSRNTTDNQAKGRKSFASANMFTPYDFISSPFISKKKKSKTSDSITKTFHHAVIKQKRKSSTISSVVDENLSPFSGLDGKGLKKRKQEFSEEVKKDDALQALLNHSETVDKIGYDVCMEKEEEIDAESLQQESNFNINVQKHNDELETENMLLDCDIKSTTENILEQEILDLNNLNMFNQEMLNIEHDASIPCERSLESVDNCASYVETFAAKGEEIAKDTCNVENKQNDPEEIAKQLRQERTMSLLQQMEDIINDDMSNTSIDNNLEDKELVKDLSPEPPMPINKEGEAETPDIASNLIDPSEMESNPTMRAARKTFVKPFTAAKKSVPGEKPPLIQKTALKTFANKHLNRRLYDASPNDIVKDGSAIYILKNSSANGSSCEEISDDDTKDISENWSLQELIHSKSYCSCSKDGVPCLFNGEPLQQTCEGEDTVDENIVSCSRQVCKQSLLTPSSKIKFRAFCDIHLWRLKYHHCCPRCGIFCTQGTFLMCQCDHNDRNNNEIHLFHLDCYLIPSAGLPPGCPHCCRFSDFVKVELFLKENSEELNGNKKDSTIQNITGQLKGYNLNLKILETENKNKTEDEKFSVPEKQEIKSMLMAINSDKCLHLRPTGKCLYNPIKTGDVKKVLQLLVNGVNPNHKFKTHKNNTPLHIAAYFGFAGIVHILLQYGGMIDAVNDDLETPLILAVERKHLAVVRYLIFAGAQIDAKTENGLSAFHVSCKTGSKEIAQLLYDVGNFDVNIQDDGGWTPLVWACEYKYLNLVLWLLELGADPNIRDSEENIASHWAACSGESEILDTLIDKGCSMSFVNKRGDTALHIAARKDHYSCVRLLIGRGAVIGMLNNDGESPFMCCDIGTKSFRILKKYQNNLSSHRMPGPSEHVVSRDISLGLEEYAIQAVNEVDNEEFNLSFRYILKNCLGTSEIRITTTVDSMIWCECKTNCGTSDCACIKNSKCWYDLDGRLISDFDMMDPPTIFECHKLCYCPKTCINRVVQNGLRVPLQLFRTVGRGWGVRCLKDLPKGTFVCEYVGEIMTNEDISNREDDTYVFSLSALEGDYCLDGRFFGNVARFINHSCDPNLIAVPVFIQHQDLKFPHIAFFTLKDIPALEEISFNYGDEFWYAKSQTILCTCGAQSCKYSKDTIDDTLHRMLMPSETNELPLEYIIIEKTESNKIEVDSLNFVPGNYELVGLPEIMDISTTVPSAVEPISDNTFEIPDL